MVYLPYIYIIFVNIGNYNIPVNKGKYTSPMDRLEGSFQPLRLTFFSGHQPVVVQVPWWTSFLPDVGAQPMATKMKPGCGGETPLKSRVKSILKSTLKVIKHYKLPLEVQFATLQHSLITRWWFRIFFSPYLGKWSNLTNVSQMGWNHQLVN